MQQALKEGKDLEMLFTIYMLLKLEGCDGSAPFKHSAPFWTAPDVTRDSNLTRQSQHWFLK